MEKNKNFLKAYSLIELLVVLTIIGIATSIILVYSTQDRTAQELDNAAREVVSVFRQAQNDALTGFQSGAGTKPCRFQISWSAAAYTVNYWYKDAAGNCTESSVLRSYTLRSGVSFSAADATGISFSVPRAEVGFTGVKKVLLTRSGSSHVVCVKAGGLIHNYPGSDCPP